MQPVEHNLFKYMPCLQVLLKSTILYHCQWPWLKATKSAENKTSVFHFLKQFSNDEHEISLTIETIKAQTLLCVA